MLRFNVCEYWQECQSFDPETYIYLNKDIPRVVNTVCKNCTMCCENNWFKRKENKNVYSAH